jgi:uroporphyrinogen III methyltransferase/synthase
MPEEYRAEAIIDAIGPTRIAGARILIPRAEVAREILPELLLRHGAREVLIAPSYRTVIPSASDPARVRELAAAGLIDLVTFTSSRTATNFCAMVGDAARGLPAAVIGPITAGTASQCGFDVKVAPPHYTVDALADALLAHFQAQSK